MSAPAHSPAGGQNAPDNSQDVQPPTRVPRTHINATAIDSFRALSLKAKLKVCKDIEDQNDARHEKTRLHAMDPNNHSQKQSFLIFISSISAGHSHASRLI